MLIKQRVREICRESSEKRFFLLTAIYIAVIVLLLVFSLSGVVSAAMTAAACPTASENVSRVDNPQNAYDTNTTYYAL